MIMQTWRWTELLQMPNVTTVGSHSYVDSRTLIMKLATALLMCFRDSTSQMVYRATFNSPVLSGFGWDLFQHSVPDVVVQRVQNIGSFNEPGRDRLQKVLHDAWNGEKLGIVFVERAVVWGWVVRGQLWGELGGLSPTCCRFAPPR